jgi:hypothetical protein
MDFKLAGMVLAFSTASAIPPSKDSTFYIPIAFSFQGSDYVGMGQVGQPIQGQAECMKWLRSELTKAFEHGDLPVGGQLVGGCLPIPMPQGDSK